MDYHIHHDIIIDRARHRVLEGYCERHHIIPVCMGGTDDLENLVDLTPEEHYVIHQLLVKIHPGNRDLIAAARMMGGTRPNNKLYGWLKRKYSETVKGVSYDDRYGKERAAQLRKNLSLMYKGKSYEEIHGPEKAKEIRMEMSNSRKGHIGWNCGIPMTEEAKQKSSKTKTGISNSIEHNKNISKAKMGVARDQVTKDKIRISMLSQLPISCPHCSKSGNIPNMKRWHFNNCKLKEKKIGAHT